MWESTECTYKRVMAPADVFAICHVHVHVLLPDFAGFLMKLLPNLDPPLKTIHALHTYMVFKKGAFWAKCSLGSYEDRRNW